MRREREEETLQETTVKELYVWLRQVNVFSWMGAGGVTEHGGATRPNKQDMK